MLAASRFGVKRLVVHPCYTVGYGSKDHCPFPFYALMASLYGDGRPVRLANDRYEQFQSSLKRHSFRIRYRLAVDRDSGKFDDLPGRHDRRWRRPAEFFAVGVPGGGDRGAVYLLLPAQRPREHGDLLARARRGFRARLRHVAEHGRDRDAGRRGRSGTAHGSDRAAPAQRVRIGNEEHAGRDPGGRAARRRGARPVPRAFAVAATRDSASANTRRRIRASATASVSVACRRISAPAPRRRSPKSRWRATDRCCCATSASTWARAWPPARRRCAFGGSAGRPTRCEPARSNGRSCRCSRPAIPG